MLAAGLQVQNGRYAREGVVEGQGVERLDKAFYQSFAFTRIIVVSDVPVYQPRVLEVKTVHPHPVGFLPVDVQVDAVDAVMVGRVVHRVVSID